MSFPLVVSFYTKGTLYEREIERLKASCEKFDIEGYFEAIPPRGSWVENCAFKGPFVADCLTRFKRPILWLDADAEIVQYPALFGSLSCDFAAYKPKHLLSGTLFFAYNLSSIALADLWATMCVRRTATWDQQLLEKAHRKQKGLRFVNLPQGYCKIFDKPWAKNSEPHKCIVHHQASRRSK